MSSFFQRTIPLSRGARSFYEELRARRNGDFEDHEDDVDIEGHASFDADDRKSNPPFGEFDSSHLDALAADESQFITNSTAHLAPQTESLIPGRVNSTGRRGQRSKWSGQDEDGDNDVPASLLFEAHEVHSKVDRVARSRQQIEFKSNNGGVGSSTRRPQNHWEAAQPYQRLYQTNSTDHSNKRTLLPDTVTTGNPRDRALWRWVNVSNLDIFIRQVYAYYMGGGFWCSILGRVLHLV
jgi:autophagy-related protein 9